MELWMRKMLLIIEGDIVHACMLYFITANCTAAVDLGVVCVCV